MKTPEKFQVFIFDDELKEGSPYTSLLEKSKRIKTAFANSVPQATQLIDNFPLDKPCVFLVDMKWEASQEAGIRLIEHIRRRGLTAKIIAYSQHPALLSKALCQPKFTPDLAMLKTFDCILLRDVVMAFAEVNKQNARKNFFALILGSLASASITFFLFWGMRNLNIPFDQFPQLPLAVIAVFLTVH